MRHTDDGALGYVFAVDGDSTWQNLARQQAADGRGETHGFVDAGTEVGAGLQGGALVDIFYRRKLGADLGGHAGKSGRVADEIEQGGGHGGRGGVGPGDDQEVGLAPELGRGEALAGFRVARLQKVVEEVAAVGLVAESGALGQLRAGVGHVLRAARGDFAEEDLVERQLVEHGHGAADEVAVGGDGD